MEIGRTVVYYDQAFSGGIKRRYCICSKLPDHVPSPDGNRFERGSDGGMPTLWDSPLCIQSS